MGTTVSVPGVTLSASSLTLSGAMAAASIQDTGLSTGVVHSDASGNFTSSNVVNADVDAAAAIAGTKISPDFGSQNIVTTGAIAGGTNPAASGAFRAPANTTALSLRNASNNGDIAVIASDGGNDILIGDTANSLSLYLSSGPAGSVNIRHQTTVLIQANGTGLGFFAAAPVAKQTVTGSRGSNAALASLITALANLGLVTDSST